MSSNLQAIEQKQDVSSGRPHRAVRWRLLALTFLTTGVVVYLFANLLAINGMNIAEYVLLPLFTVLFSWIAFSFWTASYGAILASRNPPQAKPEQPGEAKPSTAPLSQTAVLMPIYNESPTSVFAGLQAMLISLSATGQQGSFDFFVLSDTTDPDIWLEEERTWAQSVAENGSQPRVFYRRRPKNTSRKAGNIADFCSRWGSDYECMIVLDADSVMEGETLVEMVRRMDADPQIGILQVPPTPVNRLSMFARLQQFASRFYSDIFIRGFCSWANFDSNYWGHNAIIRVKPFIEHCGLPVLPGKAPLGGEILSHDFVEAALMARAGWKVVLANDLEGSYEECPTTLLDFAKRDQRWCQGNMQHIRLIFSEGFRPVSRLHLTMGAMAYLSAPLWLAFMVLSAISVWMDGPPQPGTISWAAGASVIFLVTMALLLLPKLWSMLALFRQPARLQDFGGWENVVSSVALETLASIIVSPIMMLFHTRFVLTTLAGQKVHWNAQQRGEGSISLGEALLVYGPHTVAGIVATILVGYLAPALLFWFFPVVFGLIFSVPIAMILGSVNMGQRLAQQGLLLIPEEIIAPEVLRYQQQAIEAAENNQSQIDRDKLFDSVLTDPAFYTLHRNILLATDSNVAAPASTIKAVAEIVKTEGPIAVSKEQRRTILSDAEAMKSLHIQVRSQLKLNRSALTT
ncbi:glucans biosynthesis glucosyltransferase MdoH [Planctomicrobium sp. SH668]|uniref:glucans biosynthesis glucosyltransferase MdoH n=1 Tax=Planctomicrobium sp. SH668 TaxID=3448126 RepID=UPI003F5AE946